MKTRRILVRLTKLCACLLVLVWLSWLVATLWAERDFEAQVAGLKERGAIVELSALNRPPVPDEANAAVVLRAAAKLLAEDQLEEPAETYDIETWDEIDPEMWDDDSRRDHEKHWQVIEKWVETLAPWYSAVDRAARLPYCEFGVDYTRGMDVSLRQLEFLRPISETHRWAVRVLERKGAGSGDGVRICETLLLWARKVDPDFLISYLVTNVIDEYACESLKRVARVPGLNIEAARRALDPLLVAAEDDSEHLRKALQSEFAMMPDICRLRATWAGSKKLGANAVFEDPPLVGLRVRMVIRRSNLWNEASRELDLWLRACALLEADGPTAYEELKAFADANEVDSWLPGYLRVGYHRLLPKVQKSRLEHRARIRIARLGLAALEYRKMHGAWPPYAEDLASLFSDGIPIDPFARVPFEFVPDGTTLRIEAAVPWLDEDEGEFREDRRIYWTLK